MNVTFYELLYYHTTRCSKRAGWTRRLRENNWASCLPCPLHSRHRHWFSVCILREEETVGGCNCMGAKSSAVMCEEVKNSTPAGPISTVLGPWAVTEQKGLGVEGEEGFRESVHNNYAWPIMQRAAGQEKKKKRLLPSPLVEIRPRILTLCMVRPVTGRRAHPWTLGQENKEGLL